VIQSNKTYDRLKFLAQILLPALGTLYSALAVIWGLPGAEKVVGTILAVDTFLGVALQLSSNKYQATAFDGTIEMGPADQDGRTFGVSLPVSAEHMEQASEIRLKVVKQE